MTSLESDVFFSRSDSHGDSDSGTAPAPALSILLLEPEAAAEAVLRRPGHGGFIISVSMQTRPDCSYCTAQWAAHLFPVHVCAA